MESSWKFTCHFLPGNMLNGKISKYLFVVSGRNDNVVRRKLFFDIFRYLFQKIWGSFSFKNRSKVSLKLQLKMAEFKTVLTGFVVSRFTFLFTRNKIQGACAILKFNFVEWEPQQLSFVIRNSVTLEKRYLYYIRNHVFKNQSVQQPQSHRRFIGDDVWHVYMDRGVRNLRAIAAFDERCTWTISFAIVDGNCRAIGQYWADFIHNLRQVCRI